jgi:hypothetical protein
MLCMMTASLRATATAARLKPSRSRSCSPHLRRSHSDRLRTSNGKIAHVIKDRSFDILVSGTLSGTDRYVKRGKKFVAVTKRHWGLPCPADNRTPAPGE